MTSRWVVAVARDRGLEICWRRFSLALLNEGRPLPAFLDTPPFRAKMDLAARALRVIEAAVSQGDNEAAGRFYAEWGVRFHEADREPTPELLAEAATAAGVAGLLALTDDPKLEAATAHSLEEALRLVAFSDAEVHWGCRPIPGGSSCRRRLTALKCVASSPKRMPSSPEVLPRDEYDEEHLPEAIHLPLKELDAETAAALDRSRPVNVYCWDGL